MSSEAFLDIIRGDPVDRRQLEIAEMLTNSLVVNSPEVIFQTQMFELPIGAVIIGSQFEVVDRPEEEKQDGLLQENTSVDLEIHHFGDNYTATHINFNSQSGQLAVFPEDIGAAIETLTSFTDVYQNDDPKLSFGATVIELLTSIRKSPAYTPVGMDAVDVAAALSPLISFLSSHHSFSFSTKTFETDTHDGEIFVARNKLIKNSREEDHQPPSDIEITIHKNGEIRSIQKRDEVYEYECTTISDEDTPLDEFEELASLKKPGGALSMGKSEVSLVCRALARCLPADDPAVLELAFYESTLT